MYIVYIYKEFNIWEKRLCGHLQICVYVCLCLCVYAENQFKLLSQCKKISEYKYKSQSSK